MATAPAAAAVPATGRVAFTGARVVTVVGTAMTLLLLGSLLVSNARTATGLALSSGRPQWRHHRRRSHR